MPFTADSNVATRRSSLVEVPAYFEPGAPPPTVPAPIAQTEVGRMQTPTNLLAQEEIGSGPTRGGRHAARFSPYSKNPPSQRGRHRQSTPSTRRRSSTPTAKSGSASKSRAISPSESGSDSLESSSSDSDSEDDILIPKPEGEAGRPGRGGYNFEEALGWQKKDHTKLKNFVKTLVEERLDISEKFSKQSLASLNVVQNLAIEKFPALNDYEHAWPVTDLIRIHLKYARGKARILESRTDAEAGKALKREVGKRSNKGRKPR